MTAMMCSSVRGQYARGLGRGLLAWLSLLLLAGATPGHAAEGGPFTVSFSAGANGNLSGSLLQTLLLDASTTPVTALADTGHHFQQWTLDGLLFSTENPLTVPAVSADLALTAQFAADAPVSFTVSFGADPNGALSGSSLQSVPYGENSTAVTAVPASGYHFARWRLGALTYSTGNPLTVTNVTADVAVSAEFAPDTYTLRFQAGANGAISGDATQAVSHGSSSAAVSAVPALGHHFTRWTLAGSEYSTENPLVVTAVTAAATLTAEFAVNAYTITFATDGNGTLLGNAVQTVTYGTDTAAVEALANPGYHFARWTVGGALYSSANPISLRRVSADATVTAEFAANTYAVTFQAGANGGLAGRTVQAIAHGADATAVTAIANTGHHVLRWTLDGVPYSTEATLVLTNVTGPMTLAAEFAVNLYTVAFLPGPNGSLMGPATQTLAYGQNASPLAAVAAPGYHFLRWLNDGQLFSTDNPITLRNVSEDVILTAEFAANTYTVTFIAGPNGGLTGSTVQTVTHGGSTVAVNAVANYGYHFLRWSQAGTLYSLSSTLVPANVTANQIFVADFEINSYTVNFAAGSNGSLVGTPTQTLIHGNATLPVTAVPANGYHFVRWVQGESHFSTGNPLVVSNVTATQAITAEFALNVYPVVFVPGLHGSVAGEPYQAIPHGGNTTSVTAVPAFSYHFLRWTLGGMEFSLENPLALTNVVNPTTIVAEFQINAYAVAFQAGPNGTVAGATAQAVNHGGSATAVTALPNTGYHFLRWTLNGAVYSFENPVTVHNVTGDQTLTAEFEVNVYTVTFLAGPHGSLSGETVQRVAYGSSSSPVTATADLEYMFALWSDGFAINPRVIENVSSDLTVTAQFRDAGAVMPAGSFLAAVDLADVANGRGLWDLTGHYETRVAGRPLALDLAHDTKGRITGTGTFRTTAVDGRPITIPVSAKGTTKGTGGAITFTVTFVGSQSGTAADPTLTGSVSLKMTLTLDLANRRLLGAATLSQKVAKITTKIATYVTLDLPTGTDGTYDILFELVQSGSKITGNAVLRLANGADYLFAVKGTYVGSAGTLILTGHTTDTAAKSIKITSTIVTLEGHAAHLNTMIASGYGQSIAW
jgi:hypothetical protein